jgi:hypothetical protein
LELPTWVEWRSEKRRREVRTRRHGIEERLHFVIARNIEIGEGDVAISVAVKAAKAVTQSTAEAALW